MGKVRKELFDFTMRSYDRAKIRELGGPYLLNQLRNFIGKNGVGLCRGDGSAAIDNENGPKLDRIRKDIVLFREGFPITIKTKLLETDFLNIILSIL